MGMPIITYSGISRCEAINDIIESIALEEAALAHILNAEGEKIQKYTSPTANPTPEQLLAVNKSVDNMVKSITSLEIILQQKLELFTDCLCADCAVAQP